MNMNRFSQAHKLLFNSHHLLQVVVLGGSVALLGAACWKGVGTNTESNTNVGVENTNAVANENVAAENVNADVAGEIDTTDWLTYTNEEYGFSFRYPVGWEIDVIDDNDEGGMGTSLGSIIMSSGNCQIFVDNVLVGTINNLKTENTKTLSEIESTLGVKGISFSDVVNENGSEGVIYIYKVNDHEIRFIPVSNSLDPACRLDLEQMVSTLDIVS